MNSNISGLLHDCLDQFDALDHADIYTRSLALRNRLRAALGLPLEVIETTAEAPLCPGCGAYMYMEDGCQCGNYPPDGWNDAEPLPQYELTPAGLRWPTLAERLGDSMRDDRH